MFKDLLSDIIKIDDVLVIVRSEGAIIEMRSNSITISQKDKWITLGDNDGPCHMHIDSSIISEARFVKEQKTDRISYSIRFFDKNGERQFSTVFAKMYDKKMNLNTNRKILYDNLFQKYGSQETIKFVC
ncbi:MAG TPA: ChuX/HutX family heme-like substrate-binding protein [Nitrosopumilaceae archaeon]